MGRLAGMGMAAGVGSVLRKYAAFKSHSGSDKEDVAVFPYRDVSDVRVMISNHFDRREKVIVEAFHLDGHGSILQQFSAERTVEPEGLVTGLYLENLYDQIKERTAETVFVRACISGQIVSEDLLLFCPYGELETAKKEPKVSLKKINAREWEVSITAEGVVQMMEIESNRKIVCSDNYFPMMSGQEKKVKIALLEQEKSSEKPYLYVGLLGENGQIIKLE